MQGPEAAEGGGPLSAKVNGAQRGLTTSTGLLDSGVKEGAAD